MVVMADPGGPFVTWALPVSKEDTAALGVARRHGYGCQGGQSWTLCPAHTQRRGNCPHSAPPLQRTRRRLALPQHAHPRRRPRRGGAS